MSRSGSMDYSKSGDSENEELSKTSSEVQEGKLSPAGPSSVLEENYSKQEDLVKPNIEVNEDTGDASIVKPTNTNLSTLNPCSIARTNSDDSGNEETLNSTILDQGERLEQLNPNVPVEKDSNNKISLKSNIEVPEEEKSNIDVQKSVSIENPTKINPLRWRPCSIDYTSSEDSENAEVKETSMSTTLCVSIKEPSKVDPATWRPCSIDYTSSDDSEPKEPLSIAAKEVDLKIESLTVSDNQGSEIAASVLEEHEFHVHKEKLVALHRELNQLYSIRNGKSTKSASEDSLSEKGTVGAPQLEDTQPLKKSMTKFSGSTGLLLIRTETKEPSVSSELKESESTSSGTDGHISDASTQTIPLPPSSSTGLPRSSEIQRHSEIISSASDESRNVPSIRLDVPLCDPERIIIPLFKHLENDLLEFKAFLDGTGQASCDPSDDPDYGLTLDERSLASITVDFGTGVESVTAQNTRLLLSDFIQANKGVSAAVGRQTQPRAEGGCEAPKSKMDAEITEQKTDVKLTQSGSGVACKSPSQHALDPKLEAVTNPSDLSRQLLRLNRTSRRQLHQCIRMTREVISYCVTSSPHSLVPRLEGFVTEILEVLQRLVYLRQECSALLNMCHNREDSAGVMYVLKVKTQIAGAYNRLLQNLLKLTSNFNDKSIKDSDSS